MAFRRQDIPKTTRSRAAGEPRRLYPRFAKDRSLLPKIERAIDYLDGMVGRRRGDLSADVVLDLFGDPKLARCFLTNLADSYRYRTPAIAEVVGKEAADRLAERGVRSPADARGLVYLAANAERNGFVAPADRAGFLSDIASGLGLTLAQIEELLHLDAERNALLVRIGAKPAAEDVRARYNVTLALSILRHASQVTLDLPGLESTFVRAVCDRHEVPCRWEGTERVRLAGRQSSVGTWSVFGARVARCALHLIGSAPQPPSGRAIVHLNGQPLEFLLDATVVGMLRSGAWSVAGKREMAFTARLRDDVAATRRKDATAMNGWTVRQAMEPIVVDGALALPELLFARGDAAVALVPGEAGRGRAAAEAVRSIDRVRSVLVMDAVTGGDVPALARPDASELAGLLDAVAAGQPPSPTPLGIVAAEVEAAGWVATARLVQVFGDDDLDDRLRPLTDDGEALLVAGVGLCQVALLDDLVDRLESGPVDVTGLRQAVGERVGSGPAADALTLHLLSRLSVHAAPRRSEPDRAA